MDPENRRDYLRAEVRFPAMCRLLKKRELEEIRGDEISPSSPRLADSGSFDELMEQIGPPSADEPLYRCFQVINNKLDFIIDRLLYTDPAEELDRNEVIELSGSGLKFTSRRNLPPDSLLKMELIIPSSIQFRLDVIVQVSRIDERLDRTGEPEYVFAGKFEEIDDASREAIIKTVFRAQRKMIRMGKINREEL